MSEEQIEPVPVAEQPQEQPSDQTQESHPQSSEATAANTENELEALQKQMAVMEQEAAKLREMQQNESAQNSIPHISFAEKEDIDSRSVYVGSVDYGTSPEELQKHFQGCGSINRVTILTDKRTGIPKGYAYVEFADAESVPEAVKLNESLFRGRNLKVTPKRTNLPGFSRGRARGAFRGRARGRAGFRGGFRGRGRFVPY